MMSGRLSISSTSLRVRLWTRLCNAWPWRPESAVWIAGEAVQIYGGYGFVKDYPVEKFYRDVKLCTIGEGTSEIQRMVIAREILKVHPSRG